MASTSAELDLAAVLSRPTCRIELAAKILGVSRSAAYQAARAGELPTIKLGRRMVVPTAKLAEMLGVELPAATTAA